MKRIGPVCIAVGLLGSLLISRCGGKSEPIDTVATSITQTIHDIRIAEGYYNRKVRLKTEVFYRANEYRRCWLGKKRPEKIFKVFVEEIKESGRYGFDPGDYRITEIEQAVQSVYGDRKRTEEQLSALDIRITASFFLFTTHLIEGRIRPREALWHRGTPLDNDIALLTTLDSRTDLRKKLEKLHPADPQYTALQEALTRYRKLAEADTFPAIPEKVMIRAGERHTAIPRIRRKLSLMGDNKRPRDTSTLYDGSLQEAVRSFQHRHGLAATGEIDKRTLRMINQRLGQKAALIALNLERLRWRPHLQGEGDEIVINVPDYTLRVYRNGREQLAMRVVLGAEYTPTPVFHDTLRYVVFSPTWAVPTSIFKREFLPRLREDPASFDPVRFAFYKNGQVIDPNEEDWEDDELDTSAYRIVERPGDANALGKVKFIMPNDYSIYLHDTPAEGLFNRGERALSHGCIRLERPEALAAYVLEEVKGWNKGRIREAMHGEKPVQVNLNKPFPVYIVYRTAWVDQEGIVNFREDIYDYDRRQLARLER